MAIDYTTGEDEQQQPKKNAASGYQWNADNAFNSWDLNPLANQIGGGADGVRDTLSDSRNAYLQPLMQQYRQGMTSQGGKAAEDDQSLYGDAGFQSFAKTGQLPTTAPPTAQWNQSSQSGTDMSGRRNELFDLLMQRIKGPVTPDANDPTIRAQADAFSAQQQRSSRNYLADLAEKGGPYMNMTGEQRLASERAGQLSGQMESELIGREQDYRRDSIQKDLGLYGSLLSDAEKTDLSRELGLGELGEKRDSRLMENDQFLRELAERQWTDRDTSDWRWAGLGL
jgi:hypothetical protein